MESRTRSFIDKCSIKSTVKDIHVYKWLGGDGAHGFQDEVFTSIPAQLEVYSALTSYVHVTWNENKQSQILDSEEMIMEAVDKGNITLTDLEVVLNMP